MNKLESELRKQLYQALMERSNAELDKLLTSGKLHGNSMDRARWTEAAHLVLTTRIR